MMRSVKITTPIPSLEEFGKRLGLSKARQRSLIRIVMDGGNGRGGVARKARLSAPHSLKPEASPLTANRSVGKSNALTNGKSKRASVSG
jgi:hypothetical protein